MKKIVLLFCASLLFACNTKEEKTVVNNVPVTDSSANDKLPDEPATTPDTDAAAMLTEFYKQYVAACVDDDLNRGAKKSEELVIQYCTKALRDKMDAAELDYDPFLNAQDCDPSIFETLTIVKGKTDNQYTACYLYDAGRKNCMNFEVIKVGDDYKISDLDFVQ